MDYDVAIVGGGPAGLTAGLRLRQAGYRAIVLEREMFGGALQHTDVVQDYPEAPDGITGAQLAAQMIEQATQQGVVLEQAEVNGVELFSRSRWVACSDGRGWSCAVVILAGGMHATRVGLANETKFVGRGVVDCTPCDGGFFVGRDVVIYGATEHALRDAAYLRDLGAHVTLLAPEVEPPRIEGVQVRAGVRLKEIVGSDRVEAVRIATMDGGVEELTTYGVLVRTGFTPNTDYLDDIVDLDSSQRVSVNAQLETSAPLVLACGDIRSLARQRVAAAVSDGAAAAARAIELLAGITTR